MVNDSELMVYKVVEDKCPNGYIDGLMLVYKVVNDGTLYVFFGSTGTYMSQLLAVEF